MTDLRALSDAASELLRSIAFLRSVIASGERLSVRDDEGLTKACEAARVAIDRAASPVVPAKGRIEAMAQEVIAGHRAESGKCRECEQLVPCHAWTLAFEILHPLASPSPDTDAGLDVAEFGDSIMAAFRLAVMRGGVDELYSPSQMTTMLREIVDRQVARLATSEKGQPE